MLLEAYIEGSLNVIINTLRREMDQKDEFEITENERTRRLVDRWLELYRDRFDQAQGMWWQGRLHHRAREYTQAEACCREALRLKEDHFEARRMLAEMLLHDSPEEAETHYRMLLQRQPNNDQIKFALARALRANGQVDQAKTQLDELLIKDPNNVSFLLEESHVAMDRGRYEEAERWLKQVLSQEPKCGEALLTMHQCLQLAGRSSEAKAYLERFQKLLVEIEKQRKPRKQP